MEREEGGGDDNGKSGGEFYELYDEGEQPALARVPFFIFWIVHMQ